MKKSNLNATGLIAMKKLSNDEMKSILGGLAEPCPGFKVGEECNWSIQCCSANCGYKTPGASQTVCLAA